MYFDWRNDLLMRRNSFNQRRVHLSAHRSWFNKKLEDPRCFMYVLMKGKKPVGQVRFDLKGKAATIDVSVAKEQRGKSYGSGGIRLACRYLLRRPFVNKIIAYVKKENIASQKAFLNAGFAMSKRNCFIKGCEASRFEFARIQNDKKYEK